MLQFRMKEGGDDKRFYNPNRDMVYCWPRALRRALIAFDKFEGDERCSKDEMLEAATALAKFTSKCIKEPTMPDMIGPEISEIDAKYPNAMPLIKNALYHAVFSVWVGWTMDVRPKVHTDDPIPTESLDILAERLARESFSRKSTEQKKLDVVLEAAGLLQLKAKE